MTALEANTDVNGCTGHRRDEEHGGVRVLRAWDSRQARGEEHRLRDPVHAQTERNGASDRSRASGVGVGYSTDHTDHAVNRQEEQRGLQHVMQALGGEQNTADQCSRTFRMTSSGVCVQNRSAFRRFTPQGSSFRKGRSHDTWRDVTRIRNKVQDKDQDKRSRTKSTRNCYSCGGAAEHCRKGLGVSG